MAKTIEIDEEDFQRARNTQSVVAKLLGHPKAAVLLEQARKLVEPDAPTPHLDREKQQNEPYEALKKEFEDYKKQQAEKDAENDKNTKLADLARRVERGNAKLLERGWTKDGIKALDEWREKEGIIDPLLAAPAYEEAHGAQVVPATPSSSFGSWDFTQPAKEDEDYTKKLLETRGESESLVMNQAMKSLMDFRGSNRR